ncbi:conserved hypothetical protein [Talaromyces stipitatus ATCC 10500]|uniref:NAD-dependent epimerase/dehydratase domain-containing protein n=1 Tax=Talaromyces stipitatus (strain ATCC 10500 / CBS 375.48 / QM 6759 / NRRL 1006) TaxID=441959 RepID=B8MB89_TALSN|nr:uncharacterized protein TSTA_125900 [Talaromyces stipitatus ATCC 10500]EED18878.1 conserved hypothetical protein [Talaromyces stipitatus ATCC 10500]
MFTILKKSPAFEPRERVGVLVIGANGYLASHILDLLLSPRASDPSHSADAEKVINGVLKTTQSVLEAAAEKKSVKRFNPTSSSNAVPLPKCDVEGIIIDENTPAPYKAFYAYSAFKTEGERFAFKWVKEHTPHFFLTSVVPSFIVTTES